MKMHELSPSRGSRRRKKRVGRGPGSGRGKTSCRGHKGQGARSGGGPSRGFEGGQMPLQRRLPKRGFTNIFKKYFNIINVEDLDGFEANSILDETALRQAGLIKKSLDGIKLLAKGELSHPLTVRVHKVSRAARDKVESAGGKIEII